MVPIGLVHAEEHGVDAIERQVAVAVRRPDGAGLARVRGVRALLVQSCSLPTYEMTCDFRSFAICALVAAHDVLAQGSRLGSPCRASSRARSRRPRCS